jgi:hypothetical protein
MVEHFLLVSSKPEMLVQNFEKLFQERVYSL